MNYLESTNHKFLYNNQSVVNAMLNFLDDFDIF